MTLQLLERRYVKLNQMTSTRQCRGCGETKALTKENFDTVGRKGHHRHVCTPCRSKQIVFATYGVTPEEYEAMLETQGGGCAICGGLDVGKRMAYNLSVDHDHETGKVRGLLCSVCNLAIGYMTDDPDRLRKAARYLEERGK